ncbi:MAG: hypothetical protein JJT99_14290 [Rhodobacteraceae bacterium]|nr:hypothetical protein [Paracoccaceae bacterium]
MPERKAFSTEPDTEDGMPMTERLVVSAAVASLVIVVVLALRSDTLEQSGQVTRLLSHPEASLRN